MEYRWNSSPGLDDTPMEWPKTTSGLQNEARYFLTEYNPICSTYGIFTHICPKNHPNVGTYTIHGAYGNEKLYSLHQDGCGNEGNRGSLICPLSPWVCQWGSSQPLRGPTCRSKLRPGHLKKESSQNHLIGRLVKYYKIKILHIYGWLSDYQITKYYYYKNIWYMHDKGVPLLSMIDYLSSGKSPNGGSNGKIICQLWLSEHYPTGSKKNPTPV